MSVKRFDVGSWLDSPMSRRRLDLSQFAKERAVVADICARVAAEGDDALRELGAKFDGWAPAPGETFEVPKHELAAAAGKLPAADRAALEFAADRIRAFHEKQQQPGSSGLPGLKLITRPVRRAGVYAPGGRAAYPSTVLMTVIPARIAKVPEVVLATPPRADGTVPSSILAAAHIAGVDAVYRVGGAQAIAALAYGTATIPRVDVVAGPGNIYATLAKREVFGAVGVDGMAGPTEVMVVADGKARPDFVAADLAAQLEHDQLAWAVLITDSPHLADRVEEELENLVGGLNARRSSVRRTAASSSPTTSTRRCSLPTTSPRSICSSSPRTPATARRRSTTPARYSWGRMQPCRSAITSRDRITPCRPEVRPGSDRPSASTPS